MKSFAGPLSFTCHHHARTDCFWFVGSGVRFLFVALIKKFALPSCFQKKKSRHQESEIFISTDGSGSFLHMYFYILIVPMVLITNLIRDNCFFNYI